MRLVLLVSLVFLALPSFAFAGTQPDAVVALHANPFVAKNVNICPGQPTSMDPNTRGIPCADPGPGIAGLSCGIASDPLVVIFGWTLCGDLEFPNNFWPESGGGNRVTWVKTTNCQRQEILESGAHAVAGAFYVYAHLPQFTTELGIDSLELCTRWLDEIGVCATPGIDFDLARGHEYVRFSYAGFGADLTEACERLAAWSP
jgi:hypothetical protein